MKKDIFLFSTSLWGFEITVPIIIIACMALALLIAIFCFRRNYIIQIKVSLLMDMEGSVFNKDGIETYIKKKRKKLINPTSVVVSIENLGRLYTSYKSKTDLLYIISSEFLEGLDKHEIVGRVDFDKFIVIFSDKSKDQIRTWIKNLETRLKNMNIKNYGKYSFRLIFGVYENPDLKNPRMTVNYSVYTLMFSTVRDLNIYYYTDEVRIKEEKLEEMNSLKEISLENNQFVAYIQPKVDFRTGLVCGGEMLVRWVDANQKFLYFPDEFVPLFENNGFIKLVDLQIFDQTCSLVQTLIRKGYKDFSISTNFSKIDLESVDLLEKMQEIVDKYAVPTSCIEIEITETTAMDNFDYISACIMKFRQAGFKVAMDDFGKELSSLSSLVDNPFDTIKLDKIFFANSLASDKEKNIIANMLNLLSKLNCEIVVEGIENEATLKVLATMNRDITLQGYFFSKPIPLSKFEGFLTTKHDFNYPGIIENSYVTVPTVSSQFVVTKSEKDSSVNINLNSQPELEMLKVQMAEMRKSFETSLYEQRKAQDRKEIETLNKQVEDLKKTTSATNSQNNPNSYYRDNEIEMLKRQIDDMRYSNSRMYDDRSRYYQRDEFETLKKQISDLQMQTEKPTIDVEGIISKLKDSQAEQLSKVQEETRELRTSLERERKEREELEAIINELNNTDEEEDVVVDEETILRDQTEANEKLNLDVSTLSDDDSADADEADEDDDEEVPAVKPNLSLEEVEAIIESYRAKYFDDWNTKAREELKDGYYEIINGLKYYRGKITKNLPERIKTSTPELKQLYNIVKNEFMQYSSTKNKVTNRFDSIYVGKILVAKMAITKRSIRVFMSLNPADYSNNQFPHRDVSAKKAHANTPYLMIIKSKLSVKRLQLLLGDLMTQNAAIVNKQYTAVDYANMFKHYKRKKTL